MRTKLVTPLQDAYHLGKGAIREECFAKGNPKIKNKGVMETKAAKYLDQE